MGFAENLKNIINERGLLDSQVASMIGVSRGTITHWANGMRFPSEEKIVSLAKVLGVPVQDLFDPDISIKKQMIKDLLKKDSQSVFSVLPASIEAINNGNHAKILRYDVYVGAGTEGVWDTALFEEADNYYVVDKRLLPSNLKQSHLIMMQVAGDSMLPTYNEGDWILVEHHNGRHFKPVNGVHIVAYGNTIQIKNVDFLGNGDIRCSSSNPAYPPFQPVKDYGLEWHIVGKVCGKLTIGTGFVWE